MNSIGIGIIGQGFGAKVQLPGFSGIDGAHVVGIAGRDGWQALIENQLPRSPMRRLCPQQLQPANTYSVRNLSH
jgi:hypothetical protein